MSEEENIKKKKERNKETPKKSKSKNDKQEISPIKKNIQKNESTPIEKQENKIDLNLMFKEILEMKNSMDERFKNLEEKVEERSNKIKKSNKREEEESKDEADSEDFQMLPDYYLKHGKHKFMFLDSDNPNQYQYFMDIVSKQQNMFISIREKMSSTAFFNYVMIKSAMEVLKQLCEPSSLFLVLLQMMGTLADSIQIGSRMRDFDKGQEFFQETFHDTRGAISLTEYKKILKSYLNSEKENKIKIEKIKRKCNKCKKEFSGFHRCKRKYKKPHFEESNDNSFIKKKKGKNNQINNNDNN